MTPEQDVCEWLHRQARVTHNLASECSTEVGFDHLTKVADILDGLAKDMDEDDD